MKCLVLLLAWGTLCVIEFLVTWSKERVAKALKDAPTEAPKP